MLKSGFADKLRLFSEELTALSGFLGTDLVWHFYDNDLLMNVPAEQSQHTHAFCRMIKGDPFRRLNRCIQFHHYEAFRRLRESPGCFVADCHAGARVLAVGLTVANQLRGVLFAGPFAGRSGRPLPENLPTASENQLIRLGGYLEMRLKHLFNSEWLPELEKPLLTQISSSDRRIVLAAHYMRTHCSAALSARETAAACGLSVSRFLHLFRQETGYAFSDWLQRLRVAAACRMLDESTYKLAEIAEISGIRDQSRMTRLFRRYLETTPGAYRAARKRSAAAPPAEAAWNCRSPESLRLQE